MGCFNATCIISGFSITAGDPVRFLALSPSRFNTEAAANICYVTGRFYPRTPPIRAKYNAYGSVEDIEDSLTTKVFFDSFLFDAVEKGTGDNPYHDPPVRPGKMSQDDWLSALQSARVSIVDPDSMLPLESLDRTHTLSDLVERCVEDKEDSKWELPKGFVTIDRIEKCIIDSIGKKKFESSKILIDIHQERFICVRSDAWGKGAVPLSELKKIVEDAGYSAMITCASGHYSGIEELIVGTLPHKGEEGVMHHIDRIGESRPAYMKNYPRTVSQAMVREDVWNLLLNTPFEDWYTNGPVTITDVKKDGRKYLKHLLKKAEKSRELIEAIKKNPEDTMLPIQLRILSYDTKDYEDDDFFGRNLGRYSAGGGTSGFKIRYAIFLAHYLHKTTEELENFIDDVAETIYVEFIYSMLNGQWHPSTNNSQDANYKEQAQFHAGLLAIEARKAKEAEEERKKWEDDDESGDE